MKRKLCIAVVLALVLFCMLETGQAMGRLIWRVRRYKVDIEGVVQDAEGNFLNDVALCITTETATKPFSSETKIDRYERTVSGKFRLQLPKKVHSMSVEAEREGFAPSSEYCFGLEQLSAKDVVIRLVPAVRQSRLETGLAWPKITKEGKSYCFSFRKWREIPLKGTSDPADICIYLEVTGKPESYEDTGKYPMALVGAGVEFCEAFLLPAVKYIMKNQRFRNELLQAPEDGYVSRIEVDNPRTLKDRNFYFKTRDGKYGKLWIESHRVHVSSELLIGLKYYFQPDGTRDLADKLIKSPE